MYVFVFNYNSSKSIWLIARKQIQSMPKLDSIKKRVIPEKKWVKEGETYMSKLSHKEKEKLPESTFAFPRERKEPLEDARHVQQAVARFDQVKNVTNKERDEAWKRIQKAAKKCGVQLQENDWRELFKRNDRPIPRE
jgi:hypothetical protein